MLFKPHHRFRQNQPLHILCNGTITCFILACTQFTWVPLFSGTCWLKSGPVSWSSAKYRNLRNLRCGYLDLHAAAGDQLSEQSHPQPDMVDWNGSNWAYSCVFKSENFDVKETNTNDCRRFCSTTPSK